MKSPMPSLLSKSYLLFSEEPAIKEISCAPRTPPNSQFLTEKTLTSDQIPEKHPERQCLDSLPREQDQGLLPHQPVLFSLLWCCWQHSWNLQHLLVPTSIDWFYLSLRPDPPILSFFSFSSLNQRGANHSLALQPGNVLWWDSRNKMCAEKMEMGHVDLPAGVIQIIQKILVRMF